MKFATSLSAISQLALGALALVPQDHQAGQIRSVFIPTWDVEITPGGPTVELKGTVEQVYAEVLKLNPNYRADFAHLHNETALQKRTDFTMAKYFCRGRWQETMTDHIKEGITYLRSVSGKPRNQGGPGACGRVSCSDKGAIWWCNDDPNPKTLNSFGSIANGAAYIVGMCASTVFAYSRVAGQVFHETNWNIIVRYDPDKC